MTSSIGGNKSAKNLRRALSDVEKLLIMWTEDQTQKWIPPSTMIIMARAILSGVRKRLDQAPILNLLLALGGLNNSRITVHCIMCLLAVVCEC